METETSKTAGSTVTRNMLIRGVVTGNGNVSFERLLLGILRLVEFLLWRYDQCAISSMSKHNYCVAVLFRLERGYRHSGAENNVTINLTAL